MHSSRSELQTYCQSWVRSWVAPCTLPPLVMQTLSLRAFPVQQLYVGNLQVEICGLSITCRIGQQQACAETLVADCVASADDEKTGKGRRE